MHHYFQRILIVELVDFPQFLKFPVVEMESLEHGHSLEGPPVFYSPLELAVVLYTLTIAYF